MIAQTIAAVGISLVLMVLVGTIFKGILGLRTAVNYLIQQATLGVAAGVAFSVGWPIVAVATIAATPIVMHAARILMLKYVERKVARGGYGDEAKWAYELFEEEDTEFMRAQAHLPSMHLREVAVIADTKNEFRNLMVERFDEYVEENA